MSTPMFAEIKKEYLMDTPKEVKNTNDNIDNNDATLEPPRKKQKKMNERGQNKNRGRKNKITYNCQLCPDIAMGKTCKFADNKKRDCKFSHDVKKYLKCDKPKDIGSRCIFFEALGKCPYGYLCRFAEAHIDDDGKLMTETKPVKEEKEEKKSNEQQDTAMTNSKQPV